MSVHPTLELPAPDLYSEEYYLTDNGEPQGTFAFNDRTLLRARAIAEAGALDRGARIVDFGCGLGAMVAAFNKLGYDACGVDPSPYAATHPLPEASGYVQTLGPTGLGTFDTDAFALAFAKDVFEHIPKQRIPALSDELLRVAEKLLLIMPITDEDGNFIFDSYEQDTSHVTRLTKEGWLGLLSQADASVQELADLTPKVRRPDKVAGTVCALLTRPD